jgi:hypothetical protein
VTHRRQWTFTAEALTVDDEIQGQGIHTVALPWHLHPGVIATCRQDAPPVVELRTTAGRLLAHLYMDPTLHLEISSTHWHPAFGVSIPNRTVLGHWRGALPLRIRTVFQWEGASK